MKTIRRLLTSGVVSLALAFGAVAMIGGCESTRHHHHHRHHAGPVPRPRCHPAHFQRRAVAYYDGNRGDEIREVREARREDRWDD